MSQFEKFKERLKSSQDPIYISPGELLFLVAYTNGLQLNPLGTYLNKGTSYVRTVNTRTSAIDESTAERISDLFEEHPYNDAALWASTKPIAINSMDDIPFIDEDKHQDMFKICSNSPEAIRVRFLELKAIRDEKKVAENKPRSSAYHSHLREGIYEETSAVFQKALGESPEPIQGDSTEKASLVAFVELLMKHNDLPNRKLLKCAQENETLPDAVATKMAKLFKDAPFNSSEFWKQSEFDVKSDSDIPRIPNSKASVFYRVTEIPRKNHAAPDSFQMQHPSQNNPVDRKLLLENLTNEPERKIKNINYAETMSSTYPELGPNIDISYLDRSKGR